MDEALTRFGKRFGVAFQVADDILDLVGTDGQSGKPQGRDLAERKWTLPLIRAFECAEPSVRSQLTEILAGERVSRQDVLTVRELAEAAGAIDYAWGRAEEWLRSAREQLDAVPESSAREALLAMAGERFPMPVMSGLP